jgi:hypothetical protein
VHLGSRLSKSLSLEAAIGKEFFEKWAHAKQGQQNQHAAAAILNIGCTRA